MALLIREDYYLGLISNRKKLTTLFIAPVHLRVHKQDARLYLES